MTRRGVKSGDHKNDSSLSIRNVCIHSRDSIRWDRLKLRMGCHGDSHFVAMLLDLAEGQSNTAEYCPYDGHQDEEDDSHNEKSDKHRASRQRLQIRKNKRHRQWSISNGKVSSDFFPSEETTCPSPNPDQVPLKPRDDVKLVTKIIRSKVLQSSEVKVPDDQEDMDVGGSQASRLKKHKKKKRPRHRADPPDSVENTRVATPQSHIPAYSSSSSESTNDEVRERVSIKIKFCRDCETRHISGACPLTNPYRVIEDSDPVPPMSVMQSKFKITPEDDGQAGEPNGCDSWDNSPKRVTTGPQSPRSLSYSISSLPQCLKLEGMSDDQETKVLTRSKLKQYTRFGPVVGQRAEVLEARQEFDMKYFSVIRNGKDTVFLDTRDTSLSNWTRYVRPAPEREARNLAQVQIGLELYFVTTCDIDEDRELLYWVDRLDDGSRRLPDKKSCGSCDRQFSHVLYYQMHISVFHDPHFNVNIRKYHCTICGAELVGKDSIIKHASEMHDGKGAYQCPYCERFFLRMNYLERHQTYGCKENPQRSRFLCDFCGRRFGQQQKLKLHVKRMHNCSRAGQHRHIKGGQRRNYGTGNCSCERCGKMFQNKSNLKIHMLTHSGVKPFKCRENGCLASFTTKQCLQFHYKKIHGYSPENMPVIVRSVSYTFSAYSGGLMDDPGRGKVPRLAKNVSDSDNSSSLNLPTRKLPKTNCLTLHSYISRYASNRMNGSHFKQEPKTGVYDFVDDKEIVQSEIRVSHPPDEASDASLLVQAALTAAGTDFSTDDKPPVAMEVLTNHSAHPFGRSSTHSPSSIVSTLSPKHPHSYPPDENSAISTTAPSTISSAFESPQSLLSDYGHVINSAGESNSTSGLHTKPQEVPQNLTMTQNNALSISSPGIHLYNNHHDNYNRQHHIHRLDQPEPPEAETEERNHKNDPPSPSRVHDVGLDMTFRAFQQNQCRINNIEATHMPVSMEMGLGEMTEAKQEPIEALSEQSESPQGPDCISPLPELPADLRQDIRSLQRSLRVEDEPRSPRFTPPSPDTQRVMNTETLRRPLPPIEALTRSNYGFPRPDIALPYHRLSDLSTRTSGYESCCSPMSVDLSFNSKQTSFTSVDPARALANIDLLRCAEFRRHGGYSLDLSMPRYTQENGSPVRDCPSYTSQGSFTECRVIPSQFAYFDPYRPGSPMITSRSVSPAHMRFVTPGSTQIGTDRFVTRSTSPQATPRLMSPNTMNGMDSEQNRGSIFDPHSSENPSRVMSSPSLLNYQGYTTSFHSGRHPHFNSMASAYHHYSGYY